MQPIVSIATPPHSFDFDPMTQTIHSPEVFPTNRRSESVGRLSRTSGLTRRTGWAIALVLGFVPTLASAAEIPWTDDLERGYRQATAEGKPMLLHFYGDRCHYCDTLEAGAYRDERVKSAIATSFVAIKINGTQYPKVAEMFGVKGWPHDVIINTDRSVLTTQTSPQDPAKYVAMLTDAFLKHRGQASPTSAIAAAPANVAPSTESPNRAAATNVPAFAADSPSLNPFASVAAASPGGLTPPPGGMTLPDFAAIEAQTASAASSTPTPRFDTSARSGMSLPESVAATNDQDADPPVALEGYCVVSIVDGTEWTPGKSEFGAIHLGQLYLFADAAKRDRFLADPKPYTPMLNGLDIIRFVEDRRKVPGNRSHALTTDGRLFMFADEASLDFFWNNKDKYVGLGSKIMDHAIRDSH